MLPRLANDPIDRIEAADPIDPIDSTDPTDPIESTDPTELIDSTDPRDPIDSTDDPPAARPALVSIQPTIGRHRGDPAVLGRVSRREALI